MVLLFCGFHRIKEKDFAMDVRMSMQILASVCALVLVILLMKKKMRFFLEFMLRGGVGAVLILWGNSVLAGQEIAISVGLNFLSVLTSATLGIPGVALLFLISALTIL